MRRLLAICLVLLCRTAFAAPTSVAGAITGVVRDELLNPLAGAQVELKNAHGHVVQTATSDANGAFGFPHLRPGRYTVAARAAHHLPDAKVIAVGLAAVSVELYCLTPAAVQTVVTTRAHACDEKPTRPLPIDRPSPIEYTEAARAGGVEGRMVLRIDVAKNGAVADVTVLEGVDPSLDAAAQAAVRTWRFRPALRCGKPVAGGVYTIARRFELGD